ncbi:long-chain fatty acid transport protein [Rhizobiales bacterium GAS191]|nr:long-chain fatty acid transport protein [Rhizobiales bacterium GAS191]
MIATRRALASLAVSAGLLSCTAIPAFAGAFGLREQSAEGQGMSFAGMAAGAGGLSSMFWNPATMTDSPGITGSIVGSGIFPGGSINPSPGSPTAIFGGSKGDILEGFVPAGYGAYQFNDRLWLGYSANGPFGLQSKPGFSWAGQVYGRSARVFSFDFAPTVAYKINDWISVGVGLQVMYFKARLTQALGILPNAPGALLEGDDTGVGYTLGVTLKPTAWTEIGLGFRSTVHETVSGTLTTPFGAMPAKVNFNMPEKLSAGIRQKINDQWTVLGGLEWDNWSRVNVLPITSNGSLVTFLPFKYKDGYFASLGVEYAWNEALTLRTGVAYERSPIDLGNRQVLLPDANRIWASLGATYHYSKKLSFDVGYSHGFLAKGNIAIIPGHPQFQTVGVPLVANVKDAHFDIISAAVTYRWDDTTQPIPVSQPIIRKY